MNDPTVLTRGVSCDIASVDLIESFEAPKPFENTRTILWMHESTPRGGHTNDIMMLMQGSDEQQQDYMEGILAAAIGMFVFFLGWMICLWMFSCMGPYEAGWLSGRLRPIPCKPTMSTKKTSEEEIQSPQSQQSKSRSRRIDPAGILWIGEQPDPETSKYAPSISTAKRRTKEQDEEEQQELMRSWKQQRAKTYKQMKSLKLFVCASTIPIVVSACLMSKNGVNSLTKSLKDGRKSIQITQRLANHAIGLIDQVVAQNSRTGDAVWDLLDDINYICPKIKPDGLCSDIANVSTCDFSDLFGDNTAIFETTLEHFDKEDNSIYYQEIIGVKRDLQELITFTYALDNKAEEFNWALYCSMVGSLMIAALSLLILIGILCNRSRLISCLRHWFLVPTFTLLVILAFIFAMLFIMGSMVVADLCVDSPDDQILVLLNRFEKQLSPIAVQFASFYINECPPEAIPKEFASQIDLVLDILPTLGDLSTMIQGSSSAIRAICGFDDPDGLAVVADAANEQLCQIVDVLDNIRLFFQCNNWFPLYESLLYNGICYNGTDGFAWVAITQTIIVFFSGVLLTLRAAFHDVEEITVSSDDDDDQTELKCNSTDDGDDYDNNKFPMMPGGSDDIVPSAEGDEFEIYFPRDNEEI